MSERSIPTKSDRSIPVTSERSIETFKQSISIPKEYIKFQIPDPYFGTNHPAMSFLSEYIEDRYQIQAKEKLKQDSKQMLELLQGELYLNNSNNLSSSSDEKNPDQTDVGDSNRPLLPPPMRQTARIRSPSKDRFKRSNAIAASKLAEKELRAKLTALKEKHVILKKKDRELREQDILELEREVDLLTEEIIKTENKDFLDRDVTAKSQMDNLVADHSHISN